MMYDKANKSDIKSIVKVKRKGTRNNPYLAGDTVQLDEEIEMTIESITRGERAYRLLKDKEPDIEISDNMEYIFISAVVKNNGNGRLIICGPDFSIVKDNGIESEELVYIGENFKPLHAGAVQKANIYFKIDKSERKPMLFYNDFKDGIWIGLNVHETEELLCEDERLIKEQQQKDEKIKTKQNVVNSEYVDKCRIGLEAYNRGEVYKAMEVLETAALSGDLRAYEILGDIHMNNNNLDKAILCFEKAKAGGIETSEYKLKLAQEKKELEEFFKNGIENFHDINKQAKEEKQKPSSNMQHHKEEENGNKDKEPPKATYNLEKNRKETTIKIIMHIIVVVLCGIFVVWGFKQDKFFMILIFGIAGLWIGIHGIVAYQSRCPQCEKLSAMVIVSSYETGTKNINKLKKVNDYDKNGCKIGEHEQWVSGTRTFTHDIDECKYCKYKRKVNRSYDSV